MAWTHIRDDLYRNIGRFLRGYGGGRWLSKASVVAASRLLASLATCCLVVLFFWPG